MAPHSSTLAWKIPWMEEPCGLQSMGLRRVGHDWATSLSLFTFMHWRRNGNPLQCSCLENPRDGEAWWAAIYGVTQSRTRLKRLSSSMFNAAQGLACTWKWIFSPNLCIRVVSTGFVGCVSLAVFRRLRFVGCLAGGWPLCHPVKVPCGPTGDVSSLMGSCELTQLNLSQVYWRGPMFPNQTWYLSFQ